MNNYNWDSHQDVRKYLAVLMCYQEAVRGKKIG